MQKNRVWEHHNSTAFCSVLRLRQAGHTRRFIQMAARSMAEDEGKGDRDGSSNIAHKSQTVAASDLLNVLSDLRVQKMNGDGTETSLARRKRVSAAANFQRMMAKAEKRRGKEGEEEMAEDERESDGETDESQSISRGDLQELTMEAAREAAEVYPDRELVESELLKELRRHDEATAAGERGDPDGMSAILSGIRVQRQTTVERRRTGHDNNGQRATSDFDAAFSSNDASLQPDQLDMSKGQKDKGEPYQRQRKRTLFDRQRLRIFSASPEAEDMPSGLDLPTEAPSLWQRELEKELRALSYSSVRNGFEEAMKLTEEGKLWTYPIDNEKGMEEEQAVHFHEHVFLDHLLEEFPQRDQVLNFMELVLIGLSKNPFLSVAQKHDHVAWFRDYFWKKEGVFQKLEQEEEKGQASAH